LRRALPALVALPASSAAAPAAVPAGLERPVRVTIQAQPRFESIRVAFVDGSVGANPIDVQARNGTADDGVEIHAELRSDTGAPIAGAEVGVALANGERAASLRPCGSQAPFRSARADGVLRTMEGGRLCVRVSGASPDNRLRLTFAGDAVHLPVTAEAPLQPAPSASTLGFDAPSLELDLDQPKLELRLAYSGSLDPAIPEVDVTLQDGGRSTRLATSDWRRADGGLWFSVMSAQLGAPGPARLVAQLAPRAGVVGPPARAEVIALRVARVHLRAEPATDEDGAGSFHVWTETRVAGAIPTGWVEATNGPEGPLVASAPFVQGSTRLRFGTPAPSGELTLEYHADDPWWLPGPPLVLALDAGAPRAPRRWPWLALLAPIGYVCLRSLQRPAEMKSERRRPPVPRPREIVSEVSVPLSGWVGRVIDAHDGQPIAGARVQVLLPSFRGSEAHALSAEADARGGFQLAALQHPVPEGARLRVWAPLHSEVERPLPPQGRVAIALTSRRRAVLRRLVRWARALGSPWVRGADPTPGEIAEIAARRGDPKTAQWAESIQAAAFGRAPVDEAVEAALRAAEPPWHQNSARSDGHDD
jgi:hypothetical protein